MRAGERAPVLLHFWATWCEPCLAELPELLAAACRAGSDASAGNGNSRVRAVFIALDAPPEGASKAGAFLDRQQSACGEHRHLVVDDPQSAIDAVDPSWSGSLPATFLVGPRGAVLFASHGPLHPSEVDRLFRSSSPR